MNGTYDPVLGFAAYGLAVVTCFALFDLGGRIAGFQGLRRAIWLALGAAALGGGLWASHILGLRALRATAPASFDLFRAGLSWLLAAGAAYAALRAIAGQGWQLRSALIAAVLAGLGLYASQYTALWSMRVTPAVSYNHSLAAGALLLGMIATVGAIFIGGPLRELPAERVQLAKVSAAVIAGAAVCSAHFTSIAAAHFDFGAACNRANLLAGAWLGLPLVISVCAGLIALLLVSVIDARVLAGRRFMAKRRDEAERLRRITYFDPTTGLPNRSHFNDAMIRHLINVGGRTPPPFTVVYTELRGYRALIDHFGQERMNQVLKSLAGQLAQGLLPGDLLARLSREGFIFLIRDRDADAAAVAEARVITRLAVPMQNNGDLLRLPWGVGVSRFPDDGTSTQALVRAAMQPLREIGSVEALAAVVPLSNYSMA